MKRDTDLLRNILLAIEASPEAELLSQPTFPAFRPEIVREHLGLLYDQGYIDASVSEGDDTRDFGWIRLTWTGYDFLGLAHDDSTWDKTKAFFGRAFDTVGIPVIVAYLTKLVIG